MIYYALACTILLAITALLGFGGVGGPAAAFAQALFYVFTGTLALSFAAPRRQPQRIRG